MKKKCHQKIKKRHDFMKKVCLFTDITHFIQCVLGVTHVKFMFEHVTKKTEKHTQIETEVVCECKRKKYFD